MSLEDGHESRLRMDFFYEVLTLLIVFGIDAFDALVS
jgi:hypothetical protein